MKKSLKRLIIDSSTKYLYLALYDNNEKRTSIYKEGQNNHSETLMLKLQTMMKEQLWNVNELDEIYVGIGPGSYTGVRIGVVVAKILGYSLKKPVFTVSSLALIASAYQGDYIVPWIDARRGYAFLGVYRHLDDKFSVIETDKYIPLEDYESKYANGLVELKEPNFDVILKNKFYQRVEDIHALAPLYLRKTEAETSLSKG